MLQEKDKADLDLILGIFAESVSRQSALFDHLWFTPPSNVSQMNFSVC
jgi:hypothetical protein